MDRSLPYQRTHFNISDFFHLLSNPSLRHSHDADADIHTQDHGVRDSEGTEEKINDPNTNGNNNDDNKSEMVYYFGRSFDHLIHDCQPNDLFFLTHDDYKVFPSRRRAPYHSIHCTKPLTFFHYIHPILAHYLSLTRMDLSGFRTI
jgi:hypothetical protein